MKRLVSMILVLILCLSLCACGSKKSDNEVVNTPTVGSSEGNDSIVNPEPVQPDPNAGIFEDADAVDAEEYWEGDTFMLYKFASDLGYSVIPSMDPENPSSIAVYMYDGCCVYGIPRSINIYLTATDGKMYHLVIYPYGDILTAPTYGDYAIKIRENEKYDTWTTVEEKVTMYFVNLLVWTRFSRDMNDLPCKIFSSVELENIAYNDHGSIDPYLCREIESTKIIY